MRHFSPRTTKSDWSWEILSYKNRRMNPVFIVFRLVENYFIVGIENNYAFLDLRGYRRTYHTMGGEDYHRKFRDAKILQTWTNWPRGNFSFFEKNCLLVFD